MRAEYLLFDLAMISAPLVLSWVRGPMFFAHRWTRALTALTVGGAPWVVWDIAVADHHWWFAPEHTLGPALLGLPLEEWGFFLVVPFACLYTWEILVTGPSQPPRPELRPVGPLLAVGLVLIGVAVGLTTPWAYTALSLGCMGVAAGVDVALGTHLLRRPATWAYLGLVAAFTLVFNNFLTGRPIVLYDPTYQIDLRLITMPVEDLGFGLGLMLTVTSVYEWLGQREARDPSFGLFARLVRRRLGGYRHTVVRPDPSRPATLPAEADPVSVAVVGGGLAGLTAAATLADSGLAVTLFERDDYLGGKVGGWTIPDGEGGRLRVDHGFHAFFRQYYNLNDFLRRTGVARGYTPIDDYLIVNRDGSSYTFAGTSTVPGLNLLALWRVGIYDLLPVALGPAGHHLEKLLRYHPRDTPAELDDTSFEDFCERAALPDDLRRMFTTFTRAFFADRSKMSMGELVKSFHFYYLSNDRGLLYDYLDDDYALSLAQPLRDYIEARGGQVRTGVEVHGLQRAPDGGIAVDGEGFDWVVLGADVPGTRAILSRSEELLQESPRLAEQVESLRHGQRYAVLRLWLDGAVDRPWPVFVITERDQVLDSITFTHRVTKDAAAWAEAHGGSVVELHCYALPDDLPDEAVRRCLLDELQHYLPEATDDRIRHEHLQLRQDFPAFHVGMYADRPEVRSGVKRLVFAGDWVKLPVPSMLMEAACTSGLYASNEILASVGVRQVRIDAVPSEGLLVGVPSPPPAPWARGGPSPTSGR